MSELGTPTARDIAVIADNSISAMFFDLDLALDTCNPNYRGKIKHLMVCKLSEEMENRRQMGAQGNGATDKLTQAIIDYINSL